MSRPTPELVLLIIASTISAVLVIAVVGIVAIALIKPDVDISAAAAGFAQILGILLGILVGYMLGRGRRE